jgi:hypothetical protein
MMLVIVIVIVTEISIVTAMAMAMAMTRMKSWKTQKTRMMKLVAAMRTILKSMPPR